MTIQSGAPTSASHLADWALSMGIGTFTTGEIARHLNIPEEQVRVRLRAPTQRAEWISPARGLWIPVPPEYRQWGAPPGLDIIDRIMRFMDVSYYVGWLSAAAVHGAAHQAPQTFQVATSRQVRDREAGRTRFSFVQRDVARVPTLQVSTSHGTVPVSTPAATMLDVASDVRRAGGIDNVATVVCELSEVEGFTLDAAARLAAEYPVATVRRIGWILDIFLDTGGLGELRELSDRGSSSPSRLAPAAGTVGEIDPAWNLYINREVEPDL
ncbi:MAG: type IV toxin-antitoxin system AbiEi family antitoxin domain-containing protein [Arachnia sp.]